jgi:hypothetical protein
MIFLWFGEAGFEMLSSHRQSSARVSSASKQPTPGISEEVSPPLTATFDGGNLAVFWLRKFKNAVFASHQAQFLAGFQPKINSISC